MNQRISPLRRKNSPLFHNSQRSGGTGPKSLSTSKPKSSGVGPVPRCGVACERRAHLLEHRLVREAGHPWRDQLTDHAQPSTHASVDRCGHGKSPCPAPVPPSSLPRRLGDWQWPIPAGHYCPIGVSWKGIGRTRLMALRSCTYFAGDPEGPSWRVEPGSRVRTSDGRGRDASAYLGLDPPHPRPPARARSRDAR